MAVARLFRWLADGSARSVHERGCPSTQSDTKPSLGDRRVCSALIESLGAHGTTRGRTRKLFPWLAVCNVCSNILDLPVVSSQGTMSCNEEVTGAVKNKSVEARIRRVFLWTMIGSFCLAAAAGIFVLVGVSFDETGARVLGTTSTVGVFSLAMLCCGAVFNRPSRWVGVAGVAVSALTLAWSICMIWSDLELEWNAFQVLLTGITFTVAFSFASLVLASATHRDRLVRVLLLSCLALIGLSVVLTMVLIWNEGWEGEVFPRAYGIVLILAVLFGVVAPLLSSLRKRTTVPEQEGQRGATENVPAAPRDGAGLDPALVRALEQEAASRGVTVEQLVAPILNGPRQ